MVDEPEEVIRRIYIRKQDLAKYGTTERCPGCRAYLRGGESKNHTEECRARITEAIKNDEQDKSRWERHDMRINERLMKKMEEQQAEQQDKEEDNSDEQERDNKRRGEEGEEGDEWVKRREARAEQRRAEREERGVKRRGEEPSRDEQPEVKTQIVEGEKENNEDKDETMAPLWRSADRTSWAWQIEGGLSRRWGLR